MVRVEGQPVTVDYNIPTDTGEVVVVVDPSNPEDVGYALELSNHQITDDVVRMVTDHGASISRI